MTLLNLEGIAVNITQKKMKNLRISIHPPHGEVKISAPLRFSLKKIKAFVVSKLNWIKEQQSKVRSRKREHPKKFISGEPHNFLGEKYLLEIIEHGKAPSVVLKDNLLKLHVKKDSTLEQRRKALDDFYRSQLKKIIPKFISDLEKKMQVKVNEFGIKKMKTRWGTCNPRAKRIWINLELAKKPIECLEFIITHEMVHLLERKHNKKFFAYMTHFMPSWHKWRDELRNVTLR